MMKEKDGVKAGGARAGLMSLLGLLPIIQLVCRRKFVTGDDFAVSWRILFNHNFDSGEVLREAGRASLWKLFAWLPLVMRMSRWRRASSARDSATPVEVTRSPDRRSFEPGLECSAPSLR